jgi:negative regulator of sigma E activity
LRQQRVAHDGKVVKEITFTHINAPLLPADISDDLLKVAVDFKGYSLFELDRVTPFYNSRLKRDFAPDATLLPAGYRVRRFGGQAQEGKPPGPRARFIVSDGVSWAEVFLAPVIGPARPSRGSALEPLASYELQLDGVQVMVIGELPLAAAKAIADAVRPE